MKKIITSVSITMILAGLVGMLFCFPFLWSVKMIDVVGAGLPFIAGSILIGCGVIALSVIYK